MAHYFITGHTGFKGAWLIFLLKAQGHDVSGLALDPLPGSIFERTQLEQDLVHDFRVDIRNREETKEAIRQAQPDFVIHMAAQALVREGYRNPLYTYETNVMGTLNVLEAADKTDSVRAQLIVTTDKVYLDQGLKRPYVETDPLGGKDPYSASKAMADILAQEYLSREDVKPGAIARAGNVIGAGDVSRERLIPDIVRAIEADEPLVLRYPQAIRPWQHVLDCLSGYLTLLRAVHDSNVRGAWNFGPGKGDSLSVRQVVEIAAHEHGVALEIKDDAGGGLVEDYHLVLDSKKAEDALGWGNRYKGTEAIAKSLVPPGEASRGNIMADVGEFLGRSFR
jgi:CDP-glucose 4,6-dehydratase